MKTIIYLLFAIVGLICAIWSLTTLTFYPTYGVQVIGLLLLAIYGLASTMIFGYSAYIIIKENIAIDKAAKEQLERDWYHYEQQCAEELYHIGRTRFEKN